MSEPQSMSGVPPRMEGSVALITGAGRGIGRSIARRLSDEGATLILADRQGKSAQETMQELGARRHMAVTCDVTQEEAIAALFRLIEEKFARLDILVNNAGISPRVNGRKSLAEDTTLDMWRETLDVNLTGTFLMCRGAIPLLKRSKRGRIVNIGSIAARTRNQFTSCYYAASKAGMLGFTRVLAGELASSNITVNTVAPTRIATDLAKTYSDPEVIDKFYTDSIPLGRIGASADVANAVAFLASADADFITGAVIDITGGQFMP